MKEETKTWTLRFRAKDLADFELIRNGKKTVETRAATAKYRAIQKGDVLRIACGSQILEKKVKKVEHFKSIDALARKVPIKRVMPAAKSLAEAKAVWYGFAGYEEKIKEFGLLAFWI